MHDEKKEEKASAQRYKVTRHRQQNAKQRKSKSKIADSI
jgi:hypothetical protein